MLMAVLRKEYVKLRQPLIYALLLNVAVVVYMIVETRGLFRMDHPEVVWYRTIQLGQTKWTLLRYLPLGTGLFLGFAQFLPEMRDERLRLSLHLPLPTHVVVLGHVLVGLGAVCLYVLLDGLGLALSTSIHYPSEVICLAVSTYLPWACAGIAGYLGAALVLLEPSPRLKVFNLLISAGCAVLFLMPAHPGVYGNIIAALAVLLVLLFLAVPLPAYRYRYRSVD